MNDDESTNIAPTLYPENYAELSINEQIEQMAISTIEAINHRPDLPKLTVDEAKKHITLSVINAEKNTERLEQTPHFKLANGELAAIPRWKIDDSASFIVSNDLASSMGLTPDEVLQIGQKNINNQKFSVKSMQEVLMEMMSLNMPPEVMAEMMPTGGPEMYVMTNEMKSHGANVLLSRATLDEVHEKLGDYVIIPSSIHELIALPISDDMEPDQIRQMVLEVNSTQVAPEEQLSDNIMMYDGQKLTLVGESFSPQFEEQTMSTERMKFRM